MVPSKKSIWENFGKVCRPGKGKKGKGKGLSPQNPTDKRGGNMILKKVHLHFSSGVLAGWRGGGGRK